jgi:hypothetical protein
MKNIIQTTTYQDVIFKLYAYYSVIYFWENHTGFILENGFCQAHYLSLFGIFNRVLRLN